MVISLKLLKEFISDIRKKHIIKSKKTFKDLIKKDINFSDKEIILQIYELSNVFKIYRNTSFYVNEIDKIISGQLKKNKSLFLIKLEIMYGAMGHDKNELREVLRWSDKCLENFPDEPEFLNIKSSILAELGKPESALRFINQALSFDNENVIFISNKALLLYQIGKQEEALNTIEFAIGIEPENDLLITNKRYIEFEEDISDADLELKDIKESLKKTNRDLRTIRFDFIALSGIFVAILTIVVKIITFDYINYVGFGFWDIVSIQMALNSPWIIALSILVISLIIISLCKK